MINFLLDNSLNYTKLGFKIFPIVPKGKNPLTLHGHKDASCDVDRIKQWWAQYPDANIGLPVGKEQGICVLDIDPRNGGDESFRRMVVAFGPLPQTVEALTGGGGRHIFFVYDDNFRVPEGFKKGIDVKKSGYVVGSPSVHSSGNKYEWIKGRALGECKLAPVPAFLIVQGNENKTPLKNLYKGVSEGGRNEALARLAGSWANDGVPLEECISFANAWNEQNVPPLSLDEVERTVKSIYNKHIAGAVEAFKEEVVATAPEELCDFLKRDIPPVEYFVKDVIQKNGRTMISAPTNVGKSVLIQNIALALTQERIMWERFEIQPARVLYLDCEMGESLLKDRFQKMIDLDFVEPKGIFVKTIMGLDLLDVKTQEKLEKWIADFKVDVLILDPIGSAWQGDENDKKEVSKLTSYFDSLISRKGASIVIVHHWRKPTRDSKSGGEMASGSYKWSAWVDIHLTLNGTAENLTVECQKSRASQRFPPFRIKLNPQTMKFEYLGDFTKKFTDDTLLKVFETFNQERVSIPDMIKKAGELKMGSEETIRKLIKCSKFFKVDNAEKIHYLEKLSIKVDPLFEALIS